MADIYSSLFWTLWYEVTKFKINYMLDQKVLLLLLLLLLLKFRQETPGCRLLGTATWCWFLLCWCSRNVIVLGGVYRGLSNAAKCSSVSLKYSGGICLFCEKIMCGGVSLFVRSFVGREGKVLGMTDG